MRQLVKAAVLSLLAATAWGQIITSISSLQFNSISAARTGTTYAPIGGGTLATNSTESNVEVIVGQAGIISNLYVQASAPGGSDTMVVTVDKNAGASTLTCTVSAAGTACNDTTHSFTVVATDRLSASVVNSTSITGILTIAVSFSTAGTVGPYNNHTLFTGSAPTLSACGTSPTNTSATDNAGLVTLGTGTVQACTMTFATAFTNVPACNLATNSNAGQPWISAVSTTALTVTFPYTGPTKFYYSCF